MSDYVSKYTGEQIDDLLDEVNAPDSTPTTGSQHLVTSGGVKSALNGKADQSDMEAVEGKIPSGATSSNKLVTQADIANFVTASVNNLVNYYLKSETYTKTEVDNIIGTINQFHYEIYASTSAVTDPQSNVLYLIGPTGSGADKYEEYVYTNSTWTKIGDTSIDLSGYVTTTALNTALADYAPKTWVSVSQNTSTGHTDINIGSDSYPVASIEEIGYMEEQIKTSPTAIPSDEMVFGKYLEAANGYRIYDSPYRAYTKNFIQCDGNANIRIDLGSYTATVIFYDKEKNWLSFNVYFETFVAFKTPANCKYFRIDINSASELTSESYVPFTYDFQFINDLAFCDIKGQCTTFANKVFNRTTGDLENNSNFTSYAVPNRGFTKVMVGAAYLNKETCAIAFFSVENTGLANMISYVRCGDDTGQLIKVVADIPSNCKMIIFTGRTASNPVVDIFAEKSIDILNTETLNIIGNLNSDKMLINELRYGYYDPSTGAFTPVIDGKSISCERLFKIHPKDTIIITNPGGYTIANYWYDKDKNLITTSWFDTKSELYAPAKAYYLRLSFRDAAMLNINDVSIRVIRTGKLGESLRLETKDLIDGYINLDGVNIVRGSSTQRVCYTSYIAVNGGKDYAITSSEISTMTVFCYDKDFAKLYNLGWFTTNKTFHIPDGTFYIRISFGQGIGTASLQNDIILTSEEGRTVAVVQARSFVPFARRFEISHLFINESVEGLNVEIPSQSLADIEVAKRLGFSTIEMNVQTTSDGKYICIHGASGKFGNQVQHIDGVTDISNVSINSVTLDYVKEYIRYKSIYPKYRTAIPTLQEACEFAKGVGISIDLSATGVQASNFEEVLGIVRGYFGENFIAGAYTEDGAISLRSMFKGTITYYSSDNTPGAIGALCKKIGAPYIHCMAGTAIEGLTDAELKEIADVVHQNNCVLSFADAYTTRALAARLISCGFDIAAGPDFSINDFGNGNMCNLSGDIEFSDFTTNGTVTDNNLVLASGETITPNASLDSHFLCGGYMQIRFSGTLSFHLGKIVETIESDGTSLITLSSYFMNASPTFTITAGDDTTVSHLAYKANKF